MRSGRGWALRFVRPPASLLSGGAPRGGGPRLRGAGGATKSDLLEAAVRAADRLPAIRSLGRNWEDVPYLVGILLIAEEREKRTPGSGQPWIDRATAVIGGGDAPITNGDYAGYAQAAMDLFRIAAPSTASRRAGLLEATSGPMEFADRALRTTPSSGPPVSPWWVTERLRRALLGGRPLHAAALARHARLDAGRASRRSRGARPRLRVDRGYLYDHRPTTTDAIAASVPSRRQRAGPLLWDPGLSLFRHDPGSGAGSYWGRGNGWAAWGLATLRPASSTLPTAAAGTTRSSTGPAFARCSRDWRVRSPHAGRRTAAGPPTSRTPRHVRRARPLRPA